MVDRYRSLVDSQIMSEEVPRQARGHPNNYNRQLVERTNAHATKMRQYITKYKRNTGPQEKQIINDFKEVQKMLVKDRTILKNQLEGLEKAHKKDSPQYNFMKGELLRAVKNEINLELQLDQEVTKRKEEKEQLSRRLLMGSPVLANALRDIQQKRAQILYLEKQIEECIQLLEIIGILTHEQGQKIDLVAERVHRANENIERAEANIDKAKINMEKSRCRMCCIIILALIALVLIVVVLFGTDIIHL